MLRGRLQYREEEELWWRAFVTWSSPLGFVAGLHFVQFGRPYDWQLHLSLTSIGVLTGTAARQFTSDFAPPPEALTYMLTLVAGVVCFGINLGRFVVDGRDFLSSFSHSALLRRAVGSVKWKRARRLWIGTGLLCSGHMWVPPVHVHMRMHVHMGLLCSGHMWVPQA